MHVCYLGVCSAFPGVGNVSGHSPSLQHLLSVEVATWLCLTLCSVLSSPVISSPCIWRSWWLMVMVHESDDSIKKRWSIGLLVLISGRGTSLMIPADDVVDASLFNTFRRSCYSSDRSYLHHRGMTPEAVWSSPYLQTPGRQSSHQFRTGELHGVLTT